MFTLKASSLSVYREEYPNRAENLSRAFSLDVIPGDTAMRETLDGMNHIHLEDVFKLSLDMLKEENRLVLGGYLAFSSDGTGTYYSGKKDCKHCLVKGLKMDKPCIITNYWQVSMFIQKIKRYFILQ